MALYGEGLRHSQLSPSRNDSQRRKSELSLSERSIPRRRSGQSFAASSLHSFENRSAQQQQGNNRHLQTSEPELLDRARSSQSVAVSSPEKPPLRSTPAFVRRPEYAESESPFASTLPAQPGGARVAEHHYAALKKDRVAQPDQTIDRAESKPRESRWKSFALPSTYPRAPLLEENVVSYEWLNQNIGDYSEPWQGKSEATDLESGRQSLDFMQRRRIWMERFKYKVLHSPMVPLLIRLTVFVFCVIALALGGSIRHFSTKFDRPQGASTDMAIIVDAVALVYLVYITYDEYTGKPLGLRPAKAKIRLIFLDLFFIVFASANLSLAFESLSNVTGSCTSARVNNTLDQRNDPICTRQEALASVLLIVLIAWLMTFAISVLRVMERVAAPR